MLNFLKKKKKVGPVLKVLFSKLFNICWSFFFFIKFRRRRFSRKYHSSPFRSFTLSKPLGGVRIVWSYYFGNRAVGSKAISSDVRCHGRPVRSLTTRQRDFLFKYRILRKHLRRRRSRPVRAVVSLENAALSRYHRPAFLARAREVPPPVCPILPSP